MSIEKLRKIIKYRSTWNHATIPRIQIEAALKEHDELTAEVSRLRQEIADLKDLAYERAPKLMAEQANKQIDPLKAEIERLRSELGYIANAKHGNIECEFRAWAQNRARHAIGEKPGELTIKKT